MKLTPEVDYQRYVIARIRAVLDPDDATVSVLDQTYTDFNDVHERVFDNVPDTAILPYIRIDSYEVDPDESECIDGSKHSLTIQVFTEKAGKAQAKTIAHILKKAFHNREDNLTDNGLSNQIIDGITFVKEPDNRRYRAVISLSATVEDQTNEA